MRIEKDEQRFGRRRPRRRQRTKPNGAKVRRPVNKSKELKSRPSETGDRNLQRKAINQLLCDLYGSERYLSEILKDGGFSQREIGRLRSNHLEQYLDLLVEAVMTFWRKKLLPLEYEMLWRKYALDGKKPLKKGSLATMYELSEKQIDRLRIRALRRLRYQSRITKFEELVLETAGDVMASG